MTVQSELLDPTHLPQEERATVSDDAAYRSLLERLSHQSVLKHYDPFEDIPWDDPDFALDVEDPRFELTEDSALGSTDWYRRQLQAVRARIGAHMIATFMKVGVQFESVLKRGLLEYAQRLPNRSPEFRYVYHEVIEEARHSLMFQEFVDRSGFEIPGMPAWMRFASREVIRLGRAFPELFFVFVLAGEDPIDHQQRVAMQQTAGIPHPLVRRICQIHVIEEARHLSFARAYLRRHVPALRGVRLHMLRLRTPFILSETARVMMQPSRQIVRQYGIPRAVIRQAYRKNPVHRRNVHDALAKVRRLCVELGIVAPPYTRLWRWLGIWPGAEALPGRTG